MHPSTAAILRHFEFGHLPAHLQEVSQPFHQLAQEMAGKLDGPELTAGLRKLLEAKDCFVRAALGSGQAADPAPSDEDRIREAMAEAADYPGRMVTR
jgi:hypothetical protein